MQEVFMTAFADELEKVGGFWSSSDGKAKAEKLNKYIKAAGGNVQKGVDAYNKAKKVKKPKLPSLSLGS